MFSSKENSKTEVLGVTVKVPPDVSTLPFNATTWKGDVVPVPTLPKATLAEDGITDADTGMINTLP